MGARFRGMALVVVAFLPAASSALGAGKAQPTIEACATLMPPGKVYSFEIRGTADTIGSAVRVKGNFTVSDPSLQHVGDEMPAEARDFIECVAALIR